MKKILSIVLLFFLLSLAFTQPDDHVVKVQILPSVDKVQPGNSYPVAVRLQIDPAFHINSNHPNEDFLIPTSIQFKSDPGVTVGRLEYPEGESRKFEFSEVPLSVYEGTVYVYTTISVSSESVLNKINLAGTIEYQACNSQTCLPPENLDFSEAIPMAAPNETVVPLHQDIFKKTAAASVPGVTQNATDNDFAKTFAERGLFLSFIFVFLGGLALNLTPCVYPLIPITISYFGGQSDGKKGSLITHALIYVLGMAITYSILGVIAALTGSLFGAALQNPYVLVALAVILVGLALSMFDLYEIRVPAFLSNFAGGSRRGFFGTFFMGLTVGIVAAPCIGPFVLALLTFVGGKGSVLLGFWLFFVLALGLGVPFIFLAVFSGGLNRIPRSGAWMIWVRAIFGFILIGMAIYFMSPLFPNPLLYYLALAFTMLIGGIYMAWIEPTKSTGKVFPVIRNVTGLLFFGAALFLTTNGIQSYVDARLEKATINTPASETVSRIDWQPYSEEKLQEASTNGRPVMIDFYADWCIPCKELEKYTFSAPQVVDLSKKMMMLKVDLTRSGDPKVKALKAQYKIRGVPTLVFLNPNGKELNNLRSVGFKEKEAFVPLMKSALESHLQ